jgi:YD repeat-containing protein
VTYANSWAVTSLTGPNGANGTTTYDSYGRPEKTKIPDGAETTYTYAYPAMANQQTATLGTGTAARWKRTTQDGFGRVTRVESGNGAATNPSVSQVDTQYAPCACSPLGKMWRVSMPYAPGGTPVWTTYTYDGSGRTLTVTAPDGSVTRTEYLTAYGGYTGNLVKVTDAAGKWKIQQTDAMGQLARVIEPNPAGGADWITNYTYDALGHLTGVSMPRSNGTGSYTQTRSFVYTGNDLTSATNPENGTVTYQYDGSHRVTKRTDAKGQEARYTYDATSVYLPKDSLALTLNGSTRWPTAWELRKLGETRGGGTPAKVRQILERIAAAIQETTREVRSYANEHPEFAGIGQRMLQEWEIGVNSSLRG